MPVDALPARPALELCNVSKYYGDLPALKAVSLRVELGDSLLVYGSNGAGKTTLLRMLASLSRPSEGRVLFCGRDIHQNSSAKARIGFVSHAPFLYGELTARENLRFAGTLFGLPGLALKIETALDLFGVGERADELVRTLSRGLQQRVTLARAILHDPDFLLLDEPFAGLDAQAGKNLQSILAGLRERGKSLIFSTHDFAQGAALAKRVILIQRGHARYEGPPSEVPV
jgi:heme exporter protein A